MSNALQLCCSWSITTRVHPSSNVTRYEIKLFLLFQKFGFKSNAQSWLLSPPAFTKDVLETSPHNLTKRWSNWFLSLSSTHTHTCTHTHTHTHTHTKALRETLLEIEIIFSKKHWVPQPPTRYVLSCRILAAYLWERTGENLTCWQVSPELWGYTWREIPVAASQRRLRMGGCLEETRTEGEERGQLRG